MAERSGLTHISTDLATMVAYYNLDQPKRVHDNGQLLRSVRLATAGCFRSGLPRFNHRYLASSDLLRPHYWSLRKQQSILFALSSMILQTMYTERLIELISNSNLAIYREEIHDSDLNDCVHGYKCLVGLLHLIQ
jgi:hypothetical protein